MIKQFLLKIYTCTLNSPEKTNKYQRIARDAEWESIKPFLKKNMFLDVGAGAGYAMKRAQEELNCEVFGIDPDPKGHGVGRTGSNYELNLNIVKGFAENLPFEDGFFDTVYSSHVLEHVSDLNQSLTEMNRVCKIDGKIIIIVPSATMAYINWITHILVKTHITFVNVFFSWLIATAKSRWWELFIPSSHSFPSLPLYYDLKNYKRKVWKQKIESILEIEEIILPFLYPYPEYIQLFKGHKNRFFSSSIVFICSRTHA